MSYPIKMSIYILLTSLFEYIMKQKYVITCHQFKILNMANRHFQFKKNLHMRPDKSLPEVTTLTILTPLGVNPQTPIYKYTGRNPKV